MKIRKITENAPRGGKYENGDVVQGLDYTNDHVAALLSGREDIAEVRLSFTDGTVKTYSRAIESAPHAV